jgi:hypothetical protein
MNIRHELPTTSLTIPDMSGYARLIGTLRQSRNKNHVYRLGVRRKVLSMKRSCKYAVLMLVFVLTAYSDIGATTCVANNIFKVKQVCGRVVDPMDAPIPGVEVELLDSHSNILQQVHTNESGTFDIQNVLPGQYVIRVQFAGGIR